MGNTTIARNLKKTSSVLLKDGTLLEGVSYRDYKNGTRPTVQAPVQEETIEEKRARLQAELDSLN